MALRTAKIKVRQADGSYKTITTTYDDSNESLAKKLSKQTIETPETTNTSTISNKKTNTNTNTLNSRSRMKESHLQRYNLDGSNKLTNSIGQKLNNMATKKYNSELFKQDLEDTLTKQNKIQNYTTITGQTPKITDNTSDKEKFLIQKTNERLQKEAEEKAQQEAYNKLPISQKVKLANQNIRKSALNSAIEVGKGIVDFSEGILDAGIQFGSSKYNPVMWVRTGQTPWSKDQSKLNSYQNIAKEIVEKDASQSFIDNQLGYNKKLANGKTVQETLDKNSLINSKNFGGRLFRNIGTQLPGYLTGSEVGSLTSMGITSFGSGTEEAYKNGATRGQATGYGLLNSAIEVGTEKLFAGVGGVYGSGEIDQAIINGINKNIKSKLGQQLVKFGVSATGEGVEEVLGDLAQPLAKKLTYASKEDLTKLYKDENYLEDFVSGALSAMIMQGTTLPMQNAQQSQMIDAIQTRVTNNNVIDIYNEIKETNQDLMDYEVANIVNTALKNKGIETINFQEALKNQNENIEQNNKIDTPQEVQQEVKEEVQEEIQEQPKTQPTISERKIDEIIKNVTKDSKIDYTQEEIADLKKTLYNEVEKLGGKVEEIKQQQNVQEQKTPIKDAMKQYTENDIKRFSTGNNLIDGVNSNLKAFAEKFYDRETKRAKRKEAPVKSQKMFLGRISDKLSSKINNLLNNSGRFNQKYETKDTNIVISSDNIEHIYNHHGNEKLPGQIDVTPENLSKYAEVISNPDYIGLSSQLSRGNTPTLYFTKKINGYSVAVEVLSTKKQLYPQSYYVFESDSKEYKDFIKNNKLKKAWDVESDDSKSPDINVQDDTSAAFTTNNDTTKTNKSQIAPSQNSMQQNEKNTPKEKNTIEERIEKNEQTLKISQMSDNKLKETSKTIAEQINKDGGLTLKQRKWISTSTESEILDNAVSIENLDPNKIYYTPIGNKTTLDKANKNLNKLGYEDSIKYIQNKLSTGERISASDVALSERLIQEAVKKGDTKTAQELIMYTAILGTEYGQTIQALSIIQKLTPEGQLKMLDKIVMREKSKGNKTFEGVEITPEMVEKILKAYSKDGTYNQDDLNRRVEEVKQEIADQLKTTVGEKIDAWRYLSMLGNPKTHIRNIVSNVAMKGAIKYKNALARTMETIIPIKNRTKTWKKSSEVVKDFAKQKATELRVVISGETKYSEKTSIESKKQIFKTKFLDKLYNTNSALLDVEDWLFSKSAFESTFREYLTAHDIKTQQDIDNNPTIVEKAQNYAIEQAQIATFRQYSKIASQINKFERNNKMGGFLTKAVVPFKKTPINIAKAGVNYSPLGLIKNLSYDIIQVKKGNIEASQYIDNLSQGLSGSSIALLGYVLAKAGILKGDDDKDKESKYDSALGNKAYSIKIGNDYYSLSWLSPVGMPLFVGANAYKELEENKNIDMNVVSDMLVSTLNPISEMSLVSGLTDTLTSYEGESSKIMGEIAKSSLKSYVGQFFPTLLSQIASVTDSEKRSTTASSNSKWKYGEEVLNSIKYKIPFARQTLSTYTDLWGNTQKQADNIVMRAWETFIAPYSRYDNKKKKLDEEIQEVYYKTGNIDVIPGTPNSSITLNKEKYRLSNKEYLQFKKTYGTTANNYIEAIIKNSDYKKATYEDKAKIIDRVYDYALTNAQTEYFKKQKIDMSNYGHKSISNKLDMFKEENYSYDDIADYIIYNYYKYKRD